MILLITSTWIFPATVANAATNYNQVTCLPISMTHESIVPSICLFFFQEILLDQHSSFFCKGDVHLVVHSVSVIMDLHTTGQQCICFADREPPVCRVKNNRFQFYWSLHNVVQ